MLWALPLGLGHPAGLAHSSQERRPPTSSELRRGLLGTWPCAHLVAPSHLTLVLSPHVLGSLEGLGQDEMPDDI